ncbi:MAG: XisI protein [Elainellaceae cyanobacterium]
MDRVGQYRRIVCQFLKDFAEGDPEAQLVFDTERNRYLVLYSGWRGESRIYGCAIYLDVIEEKVWIQQNSTEIDVYRELVEQGIAAKDLVLGFRSPAIRERLAAAL